MNLSSQPRLALKIVFVVDDGPGLPHTANMVTFLFHLYACAVTECMRPKVIIEKARASPKTATA